MTMPEYRPKQFRSEIIQVGYALMKSRKDIEFADGCAVLPKTTVFDQTDETISKIDDELFFNGDGVFL